LQATLTSVVALSMAMTPMALLVYEKAVLPRMHRRDGDREMDSPEEGEVEAIVAGAGRVGNSVLRLLRANGIRTAVLDSNPGTVEALRKVGLHAWYGDASRPDLLHAAGAAHAKVLVVAIDDVEKTKAIADHARHHYPQLKILLRTSGPQESYGFLNDGYEHVFRETFGTSLDMGEMALRLVGRRAYQAHRAITLFRKANERALRQLSKHAGDKGYFERLRNIISETETLFRSTDALSRKNDSGWDNATVRAEVRQRIGAKTTIAKGAETHSAGEAGGA
jgi:voltage-gated potassium channel Kch